jgi:CcmD family protein
MACCAGAGASGTLAAEQPTPAAQDEFVPVKDIAPQDQLPAAPLLIAAYGVAWLAIVGYVWSLWRRLGRVEGELRTLNGRLSARGR